MKYLIATLLGLTLVSCTDTDRAGIGALGNAGHITCYSGQALIYDGDSTGVIQTVTHSDGWEFKDAKTGKFTRISGACIITN